MHQLDMVCTGAGPRLGWWAVAPFQFAVCIGCVIANHVVAGQAMKVRCLCIRALQLMSFRAG